MQRTLLIVRHAKAEEPSFIGRDHDRDLTSDGIMAAARVGRKLRDREIRPDLIVSSTANRARDTAKILAEQLGIDADMILQDERLFDGGPRAYMAAVSNLPDTTKTVMMVGHNPDVSYFSEYLTHESVGSMDTGAVVSIAFSNLRWDEVSGRTGSILFQVTPKGNDE